MALYHWQISLVDNNHSIYSVQDSQSPTCFEISFHPFFEKLCRKSGDYNGSSSFLCLRGRRMYLLLCSVWSHSTSVPGQRLQPLLIYYDTWLKVYLEDSGIPRIIWADNADQPI